MHCVYFARHGETVWNVENKICGMTDSPLTEKGRAQAAQLGEAVKNSGIVLDEILYSPLSRAADTALAVAAATGRQDLSPRGPQRDRPGGGVLFPQHDQRGVRGVRHQEL